MKNKILTASVLATIFVFSGNVYAASRNSASETEIDNQVQQQTQTANQGEESQIQTQNNEQTQAGTADQAENGSGAGDQVQVQNQVKNQSETKQIQNQEQEATQERSGKGSQTAEQRRNGVANAVREMLQIAERNGGIGQQVRVIAQAQTQNQEKLEISLAKVQSRSGFAKFFIGPNYNEINNSKKLLEQNHEQIKQLNQIKNQLASQSDAQNLTQQIQTLEQTSLQIESSLRAAQRGFSLFGWMFKLFYK